MTEQQSAQADWIRSPRPEERTLPPVAEGMDAVDLNGSVLGRVGTVRSEDFLLQKDGGDTVPIPIGAIRAITGNRAVVDTPVEPPGARS